MAVFIKRDSGNKQPLNVMMLHHRGKCVGLKNPKGSEREIMGPTKLKVFPLHSRKQPIDVRDLKDLVDNGFLS